MRLRWLGLALALGLFGSSAEAQVFKPKAKKSESAKAEKASAPAKKKTAKKRGATRPKKTKAADRARPDDQATETASKETDRDYVKIWDDDE